MRALVAFVLMTAPVAFAGTGNSFIFAGRVEGFDETHVIVRQNGRLYRVPREWISTRGQLTEDEAVEAEIPKNDFVRWRAQLVRSSVPLPESAKPPRLAPGKPASR